MCSSDLDKVVDSMMIKVRKDLPDVSSTSFSSNTSELEGKQTKVELWESFKAMNDKWIAGGDFKFKTLFEDVLLIDRASRDVGDKILVDIYKLKDRLDGLFATDPNMDMLSFVESILIENNFVVMNLPSYVNFYNVTEVVKKPKIGRAHV